MTQSVPFWNNYFASITNLINDLENLRTLQDRIAQDSSLQTSYFADPSHRTDIVSSDVTAATGAVTQLLFTFDSGSPPQKAALFKVG